MSFLEDLGRNPLDKIADKIASSKQRVTDSKQAAKDKLEKAKCNQLGCKGKKRGNCSRCGARIW